MLWIYVVAADNGSQVKGCKGDTSSVEPLALYNPPSGVISVQTRDAQIYSFQFPPGTEHYRWGCYCNGWGIGYGSGSYYRYTHNDASLYGLSLVSSSTLEWGPSRYRWRVVYRTADGYFTITHNFSYCLSVGALRVTAVITNTSPSTQYGVKFKRYIDWDMNPGYFSNNRFYRTSNMCYAVASSGNRYAGLAALSPAPSVVELYGWDHYYTYTSSFDYSSYTGDGYCLLDWYLGSLSPGESRVVDACYAAGNSYGNLSANVSACASCVVGQDDDLGVSEHAESQSTSVKVVPGGLVVEGYRGELNIYMGDGRLVRSVKDYRGEIVPLASGVYIVKMSGSTATVVVR